MIRAAVVLLSLFLLVSCGEDLVTAPEPSPSPSISPSPSPDVAALCSVRGTRILFERVDKNKPANPFVTSWPQGVIPIAHALPIYEGQSDPDFDPDKCRAFDRVRWWCTGASSCQWIGDQTAPDIYLKVNQAGYHCARAQPLDLTEFGEACFVVQP